MKKTSLGDKIGIKLTFTEVLYDHGFADGISLLSHRYGDIQRNKEELARNAGKMGYRSNKTKTLRNNSQRADPITIRGRDIEEVIEFTYLRARLGV